MRPQQRRRFGAKDVGDFQARSAGGRLGREHQAGGAKAEGYRGTCNPRPTALTWCAAVTLDVGQLVQRADDFTDQFGGDVCVDRRGAGTGVSQQDLDHTQVGTGFQ